jgi:hypothetical protein
MLGEQLDHRRRYRHRPPAGSRLWIRLDADLPGHLDQDPDDPQPPRIQVHGLPPQAGALAPPESVNAAVATKVR